MMRAIFAGVLLSGAPVYALVGTAWATLEALGASL